MNVENIKKAIEIMERAAVRGSFSMTSWQTPSTNGIIAKTEAELHRLGNKASFAGHVAVSPEFQADGGSVGYRGRPRMDGYDSEEAVAHWLGISRLQAMRLVYGYLDVCEDWRFSQFYNKPWAEVTTEDVIVKLNDLLAYNRI